jgi:superfamily II DNA helicase RecQ
MNLKIFQIRLDEQHLQTDQELVNQFMEQVSVKKSVTQFVPAEPDYWSIVVYYEEDQPTKKPSKQSNGASKRIAEEQIELTEEQKEIMTALKQWRRDRANAVNQPEYLICHNASIEALSRQKPRTLAELSEIKGIGDSKIAKYGEEVISVLNAF